MPCHRVLDAAPDLVPRIGLGPQLGRDQFHESAEPLARIEV
jgi:hypothetical protein